MITCMTTNLHQKNSNAMKLLGKMMETLYLQGYQGIRYALHSKTGNFEVYALQQTTIGEEKTKLIDEINSAFKFIKLSVIVTEITNCAFTPLNAQSYSNTLRNCIHLYMSTHLPVKLSDEIKLKLSFLEGRIKRRAHDFIALWKELKPENLFKNKRHVFDSFSNNSWPDSHEDIEKLYSFHSHHMPSKHYGTGTNVYRANNSVELSNAITLYDFNKSNAIEKSEGSVLIDCEKTYFDMVLQIKKYHERKIFEESDLFLIVAPPEQKVIVDEDIDEASVTLHFLLLQKQISHIQTEVFHNMPHGFIEHISSFEIERKVISTILESHASKFCKVIEENSQFDKLTISIEYRHDNNIGFNFILKDLNVSSESRQYFLNDIISAIFKAGLSEVYQLKTIFYNQPAFQAMPDLAKNTNVNKNTLTKQDVAFKTIINANMTLAAQGFGSSRQALEKAHNYLISTIKPLIELTGKKFEYFLGAVEAKTYSRALRIACTSKTPEALQFVTLLLQCKKLFNIDVNEQAGQNKYAAIHYAALKGCKEIYDFLITQGADASLKDKQGVSAEEHLTIALEKANTIKIGM